MKLGATGGAIVGCFLGIGVGRTGGVLVGVKYINGVTVGWEDGAGVVVQVGGRVINLLVLIGIISVKGSNRAAITGFCEG